MKMTAVLVESISQAYRRISHRPSSCLKIEETSRKIRGWKIVGDMLESPTRAPVGNSSCSLRLSNMMASSQTKETVQTIETAGDPLLPAACMKRSFH